MASSSFVQSRSNPSVSKAIGSHRLNVVPLRASRRVSASKNRTSNVLECRFSGTRLRASGVERLVHVWKSDGPGRDPKLRVVVRSALSQVPEKPLGLYDPSFDKDSCGVGFVAELSGESSRKTVHNSNIYCSIVCTF